VTVLLKGMVAQLAEEMQEVLAGRESVRAGLTRVRHLMASCETHQAFTRAGEWERNEIFHALAVLRALAEVVRSWEKPFGRCRRAADLLDICVDAIRMTMVPVPDWKESKKSMCRAARVIQKAMRERRRAIIPLRPLDRNKKHATNLAAFDFCKRPPLRNGTPILTMKACEAAMRRTPISTPHSTWNTIQQAEASRGRLTRTYYLNSCAERAEMLLGPAAGLDNRVLVAPRYEAANQMEA
jgi:hypothetical protein